MPRSARELGLAELRLYADAVFASNLLYCANAFRGASRERLAAGGELVHMSRRLD